MRYSKSKQSNRRFLVMLENNESEQSFWLATVFAAWSLAQETPDSPRQLRLEEAMECLVHDGVRIDTLAKRLVDFSAERHEAAGGNRFVMSVIRHGVDAEFVVRAAVRFMPEVQERMAVRSSADNADVTQLLKRIQKPPSPRRRADPSIFDVILNRR